jgi:hypothetical protein
VSVRTTNFDALATAAPLDRQASVVRDGSGDSYERALPGLVVRRWDAPPRLKPLTDPSHRLLLQQYTGQRVGRLTILGVWADAPVGKNRKAIWVVRCLCGYYEGYKFGSIFKIPAEACCSHCRQTENLRVVARQTQSRKYRRKAGKLLGRLTGDRAAGALAR